MHRVNQLENFFENLGSNFVNNMGQLLLDNIQDYLQSNGVSPMVLCGGIQHTVKPHNLRKTGGTSKKGYKSPVTSRSKSPKNIKEKDVIELKETSEGVWQWQ